MTRTILALALSIGWVLPALADGCYICTKGSACGQYCRYSGADNGDNRKKCAKADCNIGGTAACPSGVNIKVCHGNLGPLERLYELADLAERLP